MWKHLIGIHRRMAMDVAVSGAENMGKAAAKGSILGAGAAVGLGVEAAKMAGTHAAGSAHTISKMFAPSRIFRASANDGIQSTAYGKALFTVPVVLGAAAYTPFHMDNQFRKSHSYFDAETGEASHPDALGATGSLALASRRDVGISSPYRNF